MKPATPRKPEAPQCGASSLAERIPGLDGLRGLAVLLVVFYHLNLLGIGWVGVQLFFVLSGFLITRQLRASAGLPLGAYLKTFHGRRALRILPLYYLYLLLLLALASLLPAGQQLPVAAQWPYAAAHVSNWLGMSVWHQKTYFLDHFWSLAIEEQFYLLWPLLLYFTPAPRLPWLLAALVLAGPLLRWGLYQLWPLTGIADVQALPHAVALCTLSQLDAFAVGGLVGLYAQGLRRLRAAWAWLLAALLLIWLAGAAINGPGLLPMQERGAYLSLGYPNTLPLQGQWLWGYSAVNAAAALLMGLVVHARFGQRLFEWRALAGLGRISYAVYLFHFPLAHLSSPAIYRIQDWSGAPLTVCLLLYTPFYLCLLLGLALLSMELVERPLLRFRDRWFPLLRNRPDSHRHAH